MKKGLLISVALIMPGIVFGQIGPVRHGGIMNSEKRHGGLMIGVQPVISWQHISDKTGSDLLDIVVKAEKIKNPNSALKLLEGSLDIETGSKDLNDTLKNIKTSIGTIIQSKDSSEIIGALLPLHQHLKVLATQVKAGNASIALQKAFESLQLVFNKLILQKAEQLHQEALKLQGEQKSIALGDALALSYVLTGGSDKDLLDIQTKALNLQGEIHKIIPSTKSETIKKVFEKIETGK